MGDDTCLHLLDDLNIQEDNFANIKQITEYKNFLSRILNLVINNEIIPIEIIVKLTTLLIDKKKCNNKIMKPNIKYPAIMIKNKSLSFLLL